MVGESGTTSCRTSLWLAIKAAADRHDVMDEPPVRSFCDHNYGNASAEESVKAAGPCRAPAARSAARTERRWTP